MTVYQEWTLDVQVNLGKSIFDSILGTWTSLGQPLSFSMDRGKSDKLGTYDAGTCTVVLDNSTAALDQLDTGSDIGSGQALPGIPFRVRATKGATTVTLFHGYTLDGFNPSGSFAGSATVSVTATDWLGWTAGVDYPDSLWGAWVSGGDYNRRPSAWWRGDANRQYYDGSTSTDYLYNMAFWSGTGLDMTQTAGAGTPTRDMTSLVPGSSNPSIDLTGAVTLSTSTSFAQSGTWSTCFWYKATTGHANLISFEGTGSGGDTWAVWIDATTGYAWARVKVAGVDYSPHIAVGHNDGDVHLVCVTVEHRRHPQGLDLLRPRHRRRLRQHRREPGVGRRGALDHQRRGGSHLAGLLPVVAGRRRLLRGRVIPARVGPDARPVGGGHGRPGHGGHVRRPADPVL